MADEGGGGEGDGDPRLKMLEVYSLKTLKQVRSPSTHSAQISHPLSVVLPSRKETSGTRC